MEEAKTNLYSLVDIEVIVYNLIVVVIRIENDKTNEFITENINEGLEELKEYNKMRENISTEDMMILKEDIKNTIIYEHYVNFLILSLQLVEKKYIMHAQYKITNLDHNFPYYRSTNDSWLIQNEESFNIAQDIIELKNKYPNDKLFKKLCDYQYEKYHKFCDYREKYEILYAEFLATKLMNCERLMKWYIKKKDYTNVSKWILFFESCTSVRSILSHDTFCDCYEYLRKNDMNKIKKLEQENEMLKTELHFRPDGAGMKESEINFYNTSNKLDNIIK